MSVVTTFWRRAAVVALAAVPALAVPGLGVTAARADTAPATSSADTGTGAAERLARACDRVPQRIDRLERVRTRLHADADAPGSVAFLQARISKAESEGHADLARLLGDRLAVRKDIDAQLPDVLAKLRDAQQICAQGGTAPGASS